MDNQNVPTPDPPKTRAPHTAIVFLCPTCECELEYAGSRTHGEGDAPSDLSDYFKCPAGCGTWEHERRAHRLRIVEAGPPPQS